MGGSCSSSSPMTSTDYTYAVANALDQLLQLKFTIELSQLPLFVIVIAINIYCLVTISVTKELRSLDFFLVSYQCFSDLVFGGIFAGSFMIYDLILSYRLSAKRQGTDGSDYLETWMSDKASLYYPLARYYSENISFWSQLFLSGALALERYILVVRGNESNILLTRKRRLMLYTMTVIASFIVPIVYSFDFLFFGEYILDKDLPVQHNENFTRKMGLRCFGFAAHVPMILFCGFLYFKTNSTLRSIRQTGRKSALTVAFTLIWVLWVCTSLPHSLFECFSETRGFGDVLVIVSEQVAYAPSAKRFECLENNGKVWWQENIQERKDLTDNWKIDTSLRALKLSYGFFDSLVVIVLIRPFHEPLLKLVSKCRTQFVRN